MNSGIELEKMRELIYNEIDFIFDNESSFMQQFGKFEYEDLIEVTFCSAHVHITYIVYTDSGGQHICDSVDMDKYLEWKGKVLSAMDSREVRRWKNRRTSV